MGRCVTVVCFSFLSVPSRINFFHRLALPGHNDSCGRLCGDSFCFLLWHVCIKFGLNTKTVLMVYTNFPAHFIKSTTSMNLICISDWRGLYLVFQELLKGKKKTQKNPPNNYWIVLSHIRSVLWRKSSFKQIEDWCSDGLRFFHEVSHSVDFNFQSGVKGSVPFTGTWKQYTGLKATEISCCIFKTSHFQLLGWGWAFVCWCGCVADHLVHWSSIWELWV